MMEEPNLFAYLMLVAWAVIASGFWQRMTAARALIWTVLGAYLLLPEKTMFNLPAVPDLTKETIPNLVALVAGLILLRRREDWIPQSRLIRGLILLYVFAPFLTVLTNAEPLYFGPTVLPGLRIYDSLAVVSYQIITLVPFLMARRLLSGAEGAREVLVALMIGGMIYALPIVLEARLSPQMHRWVYGFFQHDFSQTMRWQGFRPVVFLEHGLWLALFIGLCFAATIAMLRAAPAEDRPRHALALALFALLLFLCKSVGPSLLAGMAAAALIFLDRRGQVLLAAGIACVVITYPALRGMGLVPIEDITEMLSVFGADRIQSFTYRLTNEEQLLDWAAQKPLFGWGGYARNLLHDPFTGKTLSVSDGAWIITKGMWGWAGYFAEFGMLTFPLLLLARQVLSPALGALSAHAAGLAVLLAVNLADLLPNATLVPLTWLVAGAVLGEAERLNGLRRALQEPASARRPARTVI